jgi:mannose-1-phosphate guanylyltransferase
MKEIAGVLMAGGLGTRLWPWSRMDRPKQFLPLLGDRSLVRMTWDRLLPLVPPSRMLVLTNAHLLDLAHQELPGLLDENLVGEPRSCNTAPCIALAAALCEKRWGSQTGMIVSAADHYLGDEQGFRKTLETGLRASALENCLVTLGIPPTRPETGYGYLECREPWTGIPEGQVVPLAAFREKPDGVTASAYLASGRHLWNMGTFVWRCDAILAEFERQMPGLLASARGAAAENSADAIARFYQELPNDLCQSIDFGIMENAADIRMAVCRSPWDDVGSWAVLRRLRAGELDAQGNLSLVRHLAIDTRDTVVTGSETEEGVVVTLGVEGLIIVRDGERILVAKESHIDKMRSVVEGLKNKGWGNLV